MSASQRTYRLAPRDSTGWMFGLGAFQLGVLGASLVVTILMLQGGVALPLAALAMALGAGLVLVRVGDRNALEWLPVLWRWSGESAGKPKVWFAPLTRGDAAAPAAPVFPPAMAGQVLLVAGEDTASPVGVVHDQKGRTYAASLRVSGRQFALLDGSEQDSRLALWGQSLAPFCRKGGAVTEFRWSEWAAPAGMEEQLAYLADHMIDDPRDPAVVSYRQLVRSAGPVATRHEVLATVVVSANRVKGKGGSRERRVAALATLLNELAMLRLRLDRAGLIASAPLSPRELARTLRIRLDPTVMPTLDRRGRSLGDRAGLVEPADAGPLAAQATWRHWRVDGSFHRAYYFREWPRSEVGARWMSDLLLYGEAVRTIAVSYQPVPPSVSRRRVAQDAARIASDADQRAKQGFRVGAEHRRAASAVDERDEELVAGHAEFQFAGLLTVAAPTEEALEKACARIVEIAAGCSVELRALDGRHGEATAACLPMARGVAPKGLVK